MKRGGQTSRRWLVAQHVDANGLALQPGLAMTCSDLLGIGAVRLDTNGNRLLVIGTDSAGNMNTTVVWLPD